VQGKVRRTGRGLYALVPGATGPSTDPPPADHAHHGDGTRERPWAVHDPLSRREQIWETAGILILPTSPPRAAGLAAATGADLAGRSRRTWCSRPWRCCRTGRSIQSCVPRA